MTSGFSELDDEVRGLLLLNHVADESTYSKYRDKLLQRAEFSRDTVNSLFGFEDLGGTEEVSLEVSNVPVIWATDSYEDLGDGYRFGDALEDYSVIVPRSEKALSEQRRRTKDKAEVFTPSWVCNLQNNLVDDNSVYSGAFNKVRAGSEMNTWEPTRDKIRFPSTKYDTWRDYVSSRRLEATCGEAPYLVSRYDTVTGTSIPVLDKDNRYQRIGLLDRKLRVVGENTSSRDEWYKYALMALKATYGYEWQGDNLLLARYNLLETFRDYYVTLFGEDLSKEQELEVAEIVSWNVWQMDGLKQVVPGSCSPDCSACVDRRNWFNHDGIVSIFRIPVSDSSSGYEVLPFEELVISEAEG